MPRDVTPVPARPDTADPLGDPGRGLWPAVSYVMPVLNEQRDLREAVDAIRAQDYPGETEIVLALGPSHDATDAIAARLAAQDARIHLVHNPAASISRSMNLGIAATQHPVVVRVDAHSTLCEGYTRTAVATLCRTGASNVGGIMSAQGRGPLQRAIAVGYNSRVGLGGASYHGHGTEGEAESAYLGVFRREALLEVGAYDEGLDRGEDWELNLRLRRAGHLVWFDPALSVTYWPRAAWGALARQFNATGAWRGELVRRHGADNSLRFFAPPALVTGAGLAALVTALRVTGLLPRRLAGLLPLLHAPLALYAVLVGVTGLRAERGNEHAWRVRVLVPGVLAVMHTAWGLGFLRGVLHGGEGAVDTSRVRR